MLHKIEHALSFAINSSLCHKKRAFKKVNSVFKENGFSSMRACMLLSTRSSNKVKCNEAWLLWQSISTSTSWIYVCMLDWTCGNWTEASVELRLHIIIDVNVSHKIQFKFFSLSLFSFQFGAIAAYPHPPNLEWTGNLLVILVVTLSRRLRSITNFFLANLAVADFCVGIFCVYQNLSLYLIER